MTAVHAAVMVRRPKQLVQITLAAPVRAVAGASSASVSTTTAACSAAVCTCAAQRAVSECVVTVSVATAEPGRYVEDRRDVDRRGYFAIMDVVEPLYLREREHH